MNDWYYSTFHRYVTVGVYEMDWGGRRTDMVSLVGRAPPYMAKLSGKIYHAVPPSSTHP